MVKQMELGSLSECGKTSGKGSISYSFDVYSSYRNAPTGDKSVSVVNSH